MKADDVADASDMSNENGVLGVKLHTGRIAFVIQDVHGRTPILIKNSRASRTW